MKLEEKLDRVVARYEHLGHRLATGDTGESRDYAKLTREYAAMTPIVQSIEALQKLRSDRSGREETVAAPAADREMRAPARAELDELHAHEPDLAERHKILLQPEEEAAEKDTHLEPGAGT